MRGVEGSISLGPPPWDCYGREKQGKPFLLFFDRLVFMKDSQKKMKKSHANWEKGAVLLSHKKLELYLRFKYTGHAGCRGVNQPKTPSI